MDHKITGEASPAMGDIRALGTGDIIWLAPDSLTRKDWGRLLDAIAAAVSYGADVRWVVAAPLTQEEAARRDWKESQR